MLTWAAKVLAHVGEVAIIQVPGGLFAIPDGQADLIDGDSTTVTVVESPQTAPSAGAPFLFSEPLTASVNGQIALIHNDWQRFPLLLARGEQLPTYLFLAVSTQPAEMSEGTPAGTGLPPDPSPPVFDPCGCDQSPLFMACQ